MPELYQHFSHFNFEQEQWREAAERFLLLDKRLDELEHEDSDVDHDALAEDFQPCDTCDEIGNLMDARAEFARHFGTVWARKALELPIKKENTDAVQTR